MATIEPLGILCYNGRCHEASCHRIEGMITSDQEQDTQALRRRRDAITEAWHQAVSRTAYVPLTADEVRAQLAALVDELIRLFLATALEREGAEQVGASLAELHFLQADALGGTLEVLGRELATSLPAERSSEKQAHLATLLGAVAAGYFRQASRTILAEQEETRNALVAELRAAEHQLRQARDQLEVRVQERTAELARVNEGLRAEIRERHRAEAALRQSEEKYRELLESFRDGVFSVDREGRFTYVNEVLARRAGWSREVLLGRSCFDLVRPEDEARMRKLFQAGLEGEQMPVFEVAYTNAQGRQYWLELNTSALWAGAQVVGIHGVSRDVTERKRAERALQESEERWRSLVANAPDVVITVDRTRRILYVNRVPEFLGATAEEVVGTDALSYVLPEYQPALREAIGAAFEEEEGSYLELAVLGSGGHSAWQAVRIGPVLRGGQVASVMLQLRDISEQKEIQDLKDNLIRDVSHELRTPLAKVRMSLNVLEELLEAEQIDRQRAARIGELASRNVDRLLQTIEGILDLSRLESGVWSRREQAIALEELVMEAVQYVAPLARSKSLRLGAELPAGLPVVAGDRERLFRVIVNLLENAIKFTAEGEVVVTAQCRDGAVEVAVADTGQGIEPDVLERVFERFYQEKSVAEGVGIGLTICKAIVEAHGGRIWGQSPGRGQGATFRFTLPVEPEGG